MDDVVIAMPPGMRNQLMAEANPLLRRKLLLANSPQQVVFYDLAEAKLYRAILSNAAVGRSAGGFLVQPLQRFSGQGRGPLHDPDL